MRAGPLRVNRDETPSSTRISKREGGAPAGCAPPRREWTERGPVGSVGICQCHTLGRR